MTFMAMFWDHRKISKPISQGLSVEIEGIWPSVLVLHIFEKVVIIKMPSASHSMPNALAKKMIFITRINFCCYLLSIYPHHI